MADSVLFVERAGELFFDARLNWKDGAIVKANLNRVWVSRNRPETRWSNHEQVEDEVKFIGGPNQQSLKSLWMICG